MAGKSDYLENEILDHILGGADWPRPSPVHIALYTVAPTDAGGGTEVTGGSYARASVTNNPTNFPAASGGAKANGVAIPFPAATADWGTIVAFGIFDAGGGGNLLYWGPITPNRVIPNGATASFAIGDLDITED